MVKIHRHLDLELFCKRTFMAFLTYSIGPLTDILYLSRDPFARTLNPAPGNQSGTCRTVNGLVSELYVSENTTAADRLG